MISGTEKLYRGMTQKWQDKKTRTIKKAKSEQKRPKKIDEDCLKYSKNNADAPRRQLKLGRYEDVRS